LQYEESIFMSANFASILLILCSTTYAFAADNSLPATNPVSPQQWTLEASIKRGTSVAPELRAAGAEISSRSAHIIEAGDWPNPTATVRADEKLGKQDGRGGYSVNQLTLTQALPLNRLEHQRVAAEAGLQAAQAAQRYQHLLLETRTAQAFHTLQQAAERKLLAQERLAFAEKMQQRDARKTADRLVRYLSPLERARLEILRATANQDVALAEGKWSEAQAQFRALLALPVDAQPETIALKPAATPEALSALLKRLEDHPALQETRQTRDASRASVMVAREQRYADPTLSLIVERDNFGGEASTYTGLMLGMQIPVWNRNDGGVMRAHSAVDRAEAVLEMQQRDLGNRVRQSHLHLGHLIEQAEHYQAHLLQPARQVLELTQRGYTAGEQNGLALVDASNTYFDAQARYIELLRDAWIEAAELRMAAGISLVEPAQEVNP
jgi:outer membrane protein, heavy metal efflux system